MRSDAALLLLLLLLLLQSMDMGTDMAWHGVDIGGAMASW